MSLDVGDGLIVRVASLADVIESKTASNRLKDQRALPYLEFLQEQLQVEDHQDPGTTRQSSGS
jgi:hypothetical protein